MIDTAETLRRLCGVQLVPFDFGTAYQVFDLLNRPQNYFIETGQRQQLTHKRLTLFASSVPLWFCMMAVVANEGDVVLPGICRFSLSVHFKSILS